MPTATNGDVRIYYELGGTKYAEPVVFVQGLGYGQWMWRWQRERLEGEYRLVSPDNRGTGQSDAPEGPYAMADMASDLEAVLEDAEIERAHLVGASMGGMIVLQYALDYRRAQTLTLLSTSPGGPEEESMPEETRERIFADPPGADERERIKHRMEPAISDSFRIQREAMLEKIVDWRLQQDAGEEARRAQAAAVENFDVHDRLDEVSVPALVLHGDEDRVVPVENAELLAEGLSDVDFEVIEGGSHLALVEEPDLVAERIKAFLAEHSFEVEQPGGGAGGPS